MLCRRIRTFTGCICHDNQTHFSSTVCICHDNQTHFSSTQLACTFQWHSVQFPYTGLELNKTLDQHLKKKKTLTKTLTLVRLNQDIPCFCKQCRSRSVGFWCSEANWSGSTLFFIKYVNFIASIQIKQSDSLTIRCGCGILIYSAWQGLTFGVMQMQTWTKLLVCLQ